jgi:signal recognition particle subunit SRP54
MFETLSEKLQRVFRNLRGEGRLTEQHIEEALKEIRIALLEADVNFKVVKQFTDSVKTKAFGQEVLQSLSPGQQVVKIVRDELIEILGGTNIRVNFTSQPPTVVMLVGLQGSGKTTSTGKLAKWMMKNGHRPLLVSVDVYRPAARDQLKVIAKDIGSHIWEGGPGDKPLKLCLDALREARNTAHDVLIVDTAGRLHIDEALMTELREIKDAIHPHEILFVADAMLGQDAVKSAHQFHEQLGFNGFILTKMDGDARGGAALSIRQVTGQPVKFVGTGEKYDAFELFHPDRLVSRILGMGDIMSLIEKAEEAIDQKAAMASLEKIRTDSFTLEDFRDQLLQIRKLGALDQILNLLPSIGPFKDLQKAKVDEKELTRIEAIINSMTPRERRNDKIINGSRRKRIAKGSGTTVQEVNQLLKQYAQTRKMMKSMKHSMFGRKLPKGMKLPQMPF